LKILALEVEKPGATADQLQPYLKAEAFRVWQLYQQEIIRAAYFRSDRHTAVLELECESSQQARQILASLPLVQQGMIDFEIIPLAPYPGFSRLFAE
jgi:muconolactone delta-isomerase